MIQQGHNSISNNNMSSSAWGCYKKKYLAIKCDLTRKHSDMLGYAIKNEIHVTRISNARSRISRFQNDHGFNTRFLACNIRGIFTHCGFKHGLDAASTMARKGPVLSYEFHMGFPES